MSSDEPQGWDLGHAQKQSITEVLQNPRGSTLALELPDVSTLDFSATALSLTPSAPTNLPDPLNINHFEQYLRRYAPLHEQFRLESRQTLSPSSPSSHQRALTAIPDPFFHDDFSVSRSHQLAALQRTDDPLATHAPVRALRAELATYSALLEREMKHRLDARAADITASLARIRTLRQSLAATTRALRTTHATAAALVPAVTRSLRGARALSAAQRNVRALRDATGRLQLVARAPADAAVLLASGEFGAAIDTVDRARELLARPELAAVQALSGVRARLAQAVEGVDSALREQFRVAMRAPPGREADVLLRRVVALMARIGRLGMLQSSFLKEMKLSLAAELRSAATLQMAARCVRASATRARALLVVLHAGAGEGDDGDVDGVAREALDSDEARKNLRDVHEDLEDMMASVVDRILGAFAVAEDMPDGATNFVVITKIERLTAENCFDEFKAAMKFGEEMRGLEDLASELDDMFNADKKSSVLRAKLSERLMAFLGAFHKAHVDAITQAVKADKWQEVAFPDGALRLVSAVTGEPMGNTKEANGKANGSAHATEMEGKLNAAALEQLVGAVVIGENAFKTVTSGVRYVRSICAYTLLVEQSQNLAAETARHGSELPRLFNSLVGRGILGAAALQWAGLRSITARHLSLASRTVAMAVALAGHVNEPLKNALPASKASVLVPLIESSEKDLRDHHAQLLAKILAIMMDRLQAHETVLKSLPWEKSLEMQRFDLPSSYIVTLAKEATVLHRILWSILPKVEVYDIFQRVCAAYGTHLTEAYGSLDGTKKWIRTRVAKDVTCLHERLQSLDVFKANPAAFKPLSKLYNRFAKEFNEADVNGTSRSFIRNREPNASARLLQQTKPSDIQETSKNSVGVGSTPNETAPPPSAQSSNISSSDPLQAANDGQRSTATEEDAPTAPSTEKPSAYLATQDGKKPQTVEDGESDAATMNGVSNAEASEGPSDNLKTQEAKPKLQGVVDDGSRRRSESPLEPGSGKGEFPDLLIATDEKPQVADEAAGSDRREGVHGILPSSSDADIDALFSETPEKTLNTEDDHDRSGGTIREGPDTSPPGMDAIADSDQLEGAHRISPIASGIDMDALLNETPEKQSSTEGASSKPGEVTRDEPALDTEGDLSDLVDASGDGGK